MQETICVQKAGKVFDTIVHKSFQRVHIYYISFTETILILSAWVPLSVIFSHYLILERVRNSSGALLHS